MILYNKSKGIRQVGCPGFYLATKIWGGSAINEWANLACQVPWDVYFFNQKQMRVV